MNNNETYFPVSRGLIDHFRTMSGNAIKLYLLLLSKAKFVPPNKGRVLTRVTLMAEQLEWKENAIYQTLTQLKRYLNVKFSKSRHKPLVIDINKFKSVKDFYRIENEDGKHNGNTTVNTTVAQRLYNGSTKVTGSKPINDNDLQTPNKERSKEVNKEKNTLVQNSFEKFWKLYPKKQAKQNALKIWRKIAVRDHDKIFNALEEQLKNRNSVIHESKKDIDNDYRKRASVWLRDGHYNDELDPDVSRVNYESAY